MVNDPAVELVDVSLRDGLQMEGRVIPAAEKARLFERILAYRPGRVEVTSFVHPKWVPQFADSEDFLKLIGSRLPDTATMAFVPNVRGLERMLKFQVQWATCFVAVSETFNQKNVNQSIDATLEELGKIVALARREKRKVRIYVSTLFGCPYEGDVDAGQIARVLERVASLAPDEIALSDTLGTATLPMVRSVLAAAARVFPKEKTALHVHDTYGKALMAIETAYEGGLRRFDASLGGIGGCPYAKGASGNVAIEDVAAHFARSGIPTGIRFPELQSAVMGLQREFEIEPRSHLAEIYSCGGKPYGLG